MGIRGARLGDEGGQVEDERDGAVAQDRGSRESVESGQALAKGLNHSLDPAEAPGTGTPEAGGITAREALRLLRALRGIDFVGGDLVEVAPSFDPGTITAFNGASILFEILCLVEEAWRKRQDGGMNA